MGVDLIGANLQQDGFPDTAKEDVPQCEAFACS